MRARRSGRDKVGGQGWTRPSSGREQTVGVRDVRSPRGHTRKVMGQAGVEVRREASRMEDTCALLEPGGRRTEGYLRQRRDRLDLGRSAY